MSDIDLSNESYTTYRLRNQDLGTRDNTKYNWSAKNIRITMTTIPRGM